MVVVVVGGDGRLGHTDLFIGEGEWEEEVVAAFRGERERRLGNYGFEIRNAVGERQEGLWCGAAGGLYFYEVSGVIFPLEVIELVLNGMMDCCSIIECS